MKSLKSAMTKMLLVNDEKDVCAFIARFFGERNFKVTCAVTESDALCFIKKDRPDIILLDVKMEDMKGMGILKRIKDIDKSAPIVMVSRIDNMDTMSKAKKLGADVYITKPLILRELLEVVMKNAVRQNKLPRFRRISR